MLSTGGTLLDGYAIFVLGVEMPIIIAEFQIHPDVVGLVGASLVFGAVIGAGVGGPMADHLGRKKLMLADMIIIAAGACTSALADGPAILFIGQLLVGIGVGIDFPVSSSYVSEILPKPGRARMMVATIACQSVGMLLAAAIALALLRTGSAQAWRLLLATEGQLPCSFLSCVCRHRKVRTGCCLAVDLQRRRKLSFRSFPRNDRQCCNLPATKRSSQLRFRT